MKIILLFLPVLLAGCGTTFEVKRQFGDGKAVLSTDGRTVYVGYSGKLPDLRGLRK